MKITKIETISLAEFPNVIWIQVHTDAGHVGLGETFFGSQAIHAYVHETLAPQMLGQDALKIEQHSRKLMQNHVGFKIGWAPRIARCGRAYGPAPRASGAPPITSLPARPWSSSDWAGSGGRSHVVPARSTNRAPVLLSCEPRTCAAESDEGEPVSLPRKPPAVHRQRMPVDVIGRG